MSAPLAKTDEIVLLGGSDQITGEVNRLVSQIPPSVHALTGVDLSKVSTVKPTLSIPFIRPRVTSQGHYILKIIYKITYHLA